MHVKLLKLNFHMNS